MKTAIWEYIIDKTSFYITHLPRTEQGNEDENLTSVGMF